MAVVLLRNPRLQYEDHKFAKATAIREYLHSILKYVISSTEKGLLKTFWLCEVRSALPLIIVSARRP